MKMLYLQSNNPNNYNTVKILNPLSKEDKFINYRVVNIATTCSFSLTTESDYIKFEIEEQEYPPIYFQDKGKYEEEDLILDFMLGTDDEDEEEEVEIEKEVEDTDDETPTNDDNDWLNNL